MKTTTLLKYLLATLLLVSGIPLAQAQEQSAKVINDLVKSVDSKLTSLERKVESQNQSRQNLQDQLAKSLDAFKQAKEPLDKAEAKADVVNGLVLQNQQDREMVGATVGTVSGVILDLTEIQKHLASGPYGPQAILNQRERLRSVLLNAGPILASVQNGLVDPKAQASAKNAEQTLIAYYKMLETPVQRVTNTVNEVGRTLDMMNGICVQLKVLQDLLNQEKNILTASVYSQLTEAALLRLGSSRIGQNDLRKVPAKIQADVISRMTNYREVLESGIQDTSGGPEGSDSLISDQIRLGQLPQ